MSKAGTLANIRFNHTGLTHNGRVYMKGEVVTKDELFVNGFNELNEEEQLETYHRIFYSPTNDPVTDPMKFVAESEPVEVKLGPQYVEAGSVRPDGLGASEIGNARRGSLASASVSKVAVSEAIISETPLLPENKKGSKVTAADTHSDSEGDTDKPLVLKRKIGGSSKDESARKSPKKKSRFVAAEGTKLSSRR